MATCSRGCGGRVNVGIHDGPVEFLLPAALEDERPQPSAAAVPANVQGDVRVAFLRARPHRYR